MAAINKALLVIDVQKDFCEGGVLQAKKTKSLIQPLNEFISKAIIQNMLCVFTRDWHPADHCSFASEGGPWPPHCVQGTAGADYAEGLIIPDTPGVLEVKKDVQKAEMSYSAFGNTRLEIELQKMKISELLVSGIATEYCVKETVLDALQHKFKVLVLSDLIRPVGLFPGDSDRAIEEMASAGAVIISSSEYVS